MSIESKHAYRFEYLKSEQWKNVRIEAIAREGGKCQICFTESIHHDAHHMWYPDCIWETTANHLVVLCRSCHNFVHEMIPECKTNDESEGRTHWNKYHNAILAWRAAHQDLFNGHEVIPFKAPELREAYSDLKKVCKHQAHVIELYQKQFGLIEGVTEEIKKPVSQEKQLARDKAEVFKIINVWFDAYHEKISVDSTQEVR